MTDKAIIQGSLVDVRNVNQHKCVRMLIDVPAEHAPMVMAAFGWPTMANPVPVAVAHITEEAVSMSWTMNAPPPAKSKRTWDQLSRAEQAGIACEDGYFKQYLEEVKGFDLSEESAADVVRRWCDVESRTELDKTKYGSAAWDKLYSDFQMWKRGAAA